MEMRSVHVICISLVSISVWAQTEMPGVLKDTISTGSAVTDARSSEGGAIDGHASLMKAYDSIAARPAYRYQWIPTFFYIDPTRQCYFMTLSLPDYSCVPGEATVYGWSSGRVVAPGFSSSYPGLMQIDYGALGMWQNFGKFSVRAGASATKYGYFHGLHTQYGINGSLSYRFNDKLTATVFGTYYWGRPPLMPHGLPMPPAMLGYYNTSLFGASVNYELSEYFGAEVGAQAVQRLGSLKYEPEPIATPYIKAGSGKTKVRIGLPVGQIMYHLLRKH